MHARRRLLTLAISLGVLSSAASGYYNWVFYASHNGPYAPIPAKFDINSLPNGAISYFISDQAPGPLAPGDSAPSLMNEIRAAAETWNQAPGSSLRLTFGGFKTVGATPQTSPGIDVVFDDNMPPGLLAQTRPTMPDDLSFLSSGAAYVKILRSEVQLRRDLNAPFQQASYYDSTFLTIVHEFGHALGLQHTMTSGVMATAITRATTRATPLSADDMAGLSMLYPAPGYFDSTGAITGVVQAGGSAVNLASVVALSTNGTVISGMTNPDGTYRIGGLPPGQYYVYAHPLPPAQQGEAYPANIIPQQDAQKNSFAANTGFDTEFFPGTQNWTQASQVTVNAGSSSDGISFNLQKRNGPVIYNLLTFGYQGQTPVPSPPLVAGSRQYLLFTGPGAVVNGRLPTGLSVSVIGAAAQTEPATLLYYRDGYGYVVVDAGAVPAPVALAVTAPNELYVLPAAFFVVPAPPPSISAVSGTTDAQGKTTAVVSGANFTAGTRIVFDGIAGTIGSTNQDGSLNVTPPAASPGYTAFVEALTPDGQTSSQALGSAAPPVFAYPGIGAPAGAAAVAVPPSIAVTPSVLLPGSDTMVQIDGNGTSFASGTTSIGFGSADILVKKTWVVSATKVLLNVSVSAAAQPGAVEVTAASGLQVASVSNAVVMQVANSRQMSLRVPIVNQITGLAGIPAGGGALITTTNVPQNLAGWALTIGGVKTSFIMGGASQIYAQVPSSLPVGPAAVQLTSPSGDAVPSVILQVDPPAPVIQAAVNAVGTPIDGSHPVRPGDSIVLSVAQLADPTFTNTPSIHIYVGGVDHVPSNILPGSLPGTFQIQVTLARGVPFGTQPVIIGVDVTRQSAPYNINILPQ